METKTKKTTAKKGLGVPAVKKASKTKKQIFVENFKKLNGILKFEFEKGTITHPVRN